MRVKSQLSPPLLLTSFQVIVNGRPQCSRSFPTPDAASRAADLMVYRRTTLAPPSSPDGARPNHEIAAGVKALVEGMTMDQVWGMNE